MKNSWLIWVFVVGVVLTVLIAFNYQGAQDTVPLSEIFPETETYPLEIEYVDEQPVSEVPQTAQTEVTEALPIIAEVAKIPAEPASPPAVQTKPIVEPVVQAKPKKAKAPVVAKKDYKYSIQIASFKDKNKAQKKVEELGSKDYQAFMVSKNLRDKGTWHRVYVGKFDSKTEANDYLPKVKKNYSSSFIIATK